MLEPGWQLAITIYKTTFPELVQSSTIRFHRKRMENHGKKVWTPKKNHVFCPKSLAIHWGWGALKALRALGLDAVPWRMVRVACRVHLGPSRWNPTPGSWRCYCRGAQLCTGDERRERWEVTWSDGCKKNKEMNTMPPWLCMGNWREFRDISRITSFRWEHLSRACSPAIAIRLRTGDPTGIRL